MWEWGAGWQGTHNSQEELQTEDDKRRTHLPDWLFHKQFGGKGELRRRFRGRTEKVFWAQGSIWKIKILHAFHDMEETLQGLISNWVACRKSKPYMLAEDPYWQIAP